MHLFFRLCSGATFLLTGAVLAQDTLRQDTVSAGVVTIRDSRLAATSTPVTYQNVSVNQLRPRMFGQEPAVLLSETPSMTWYSDAGNGQGYAYLRLRGMDQTRINISLDGVPLNEPEDQGAYFSNYPDLMNSLSSIQVQRGVGTSKSGVADYAGSIQLGGPDLGYYQPDSAKGHAHLSLGVNRGSFNTGRQYVAFRTRTTGRAALYVRASALRSEGYKEHSGNSSQSGLVAGRLDLGRHHLQWMNMTGHQKNQLAWIGVPDSVLRINPRANANSNENDQFVQSLTSFHHQWTGKSVQLSSNAFYTFLNGNYDFDYNNFIGLPSTNELFNYAFQSHFAGAGSRISLWKNGWLWTTGANLSTYQRRHTGSETSQGQLYQNTGFKREMSAFSKVSYQRSRLEIQADIQVRGVDFRYQGTVALPIQKWLFFNPKAGISYRLPKQWIAYASIGSVGREPTRNDLFGGNDDLLADSTGQPLLFITRPERVADTEAGLRHTGKRSAFSANLYFLSFRNEIVLTGAFGPNGLALSNGVDRSFRSGAEVTASYALSARLTLRNQSSFSYNRISAQGTTFQPVLSPALLVNQEVEYVQGKWLAGLACRYQSGAWITLANTSRVAGAAIVNAWVQYKRGGFTLGAQGNNLLNARYYNSGYTDFAGVNRYFIQAPVNGSLSVAFGF